MPDFTFPQAPVLVETTGEFAIGATGVLRATNGDALVDVFDLNDSPLASILVGPKGAHQSFKAGIADGVLDFGSVKLPVQSLEAQRAGLTAIVVAGDALTAATAAQETATAAQTAANTAVSNVGAGTVDVFLISSYAQVGDTDDTPAIARAVAAARAAGGGVVRADGRKRLYAVSPQGTQPYITPSGTSTTLTRCVAIPSNVTIDMQGATVQLTGSGSAAVFCNANTTTSGTRDTDIGLVNVTVNGNGTTPTAGIVFLGYVTRPTMDAVRVTNGQYVAYNLFGIDHGTFGVLDADNITGQAFALGTPVGASNGIYDTTFGTLRARNIAQYNTGSQPGNSVAAVLIRCTIGTIEARTCAAGIKIQGPSADVTIGTAFSDTTGTASGNSGLKLQGDSVSAWYPTRVSVGNVVSTNSGGSGLYLELSIDCTIGAYTGRSNGLLGGIADVWIGGTRDNVLSIKSEAAGGDGVLVRTYATDYVLGNVTVRNAGQLAGAATGVSVPGGRGIVDNLVVIDDQGAPTLGKGLDVNGASAVIDVKKRRIVGMAVAFQATAGSTVNLNDPGGAPPYYGGVRSGYYSLLGNALSTSTTLGIGSLRLYQVSFPVAVTLTRIGAEITTAGEAGSHLRLAIFRDDGQGMPSTLVVDAGQLDAATVGVAEKTISTALTAGLYWVGGAVQDVTTTQPGVRTINAPLIPQQIAATTIPATQQGVVGASVGGVTAAMPLFVGPTALNAGSAPRIFVKFA